jgi:hypothetical protein
LRHDVNGFCFKETIEIVVRGPDGEIKDRSVIERTPGTVSKEDAERLIKAELKKTIAPSAALRTGSEKHRKTQK